MQTSKTKKKSSKISDISAEIIDANGQTMTTDIGVKINDDHNSLKVGGQLYSKILSLEKNSRILTESEYPKEWFMPEVQGLMEFSSCINH